MTIDQAVHELSLAIADAARESDSVRDAVHAFKNAGVRLVDISIEIEVDMVKIASPAESSADAEFLHELGITPDLNPSGRSR
jgi:hypothetical protein